ncbi:MAG: hypothetical protein J6A01_04705 [Proteobacteria bacterium]|nr:hypothetical protein [Pseudomonadota bacterium]
MSEKNLKRLGRGVLLGLGIFMSIPVSQVFAQDIKVLRDDVRQYQLRIEKIKTGDTTRYNSEMSQISSWIDEALILIGKEEKEKVSSLVLKLGVYIDFVEASMLRDVEMGKAMEAEAKLKALKAEYGKLEAQVQQLTAEEDVLKSKADSMKK